jgi:hypothetical protein
MMTPKEKLVLSFGFKLLYRLPSGFTVDFTASSITCRAYSGFSEFQLPHKSPDCELDRILRINELKFMGN